MHLNHAENVPPTASMEKLFSTVAQSFVPKKIGTAARWSILFCVWSPRFNETSLMCLWNLLGYCIHQGTFSVLVIAGYNTLYTKEITSISCLKKRKDGIVAFATQVFSTQYITLAQTLSPYTSFSCVGQKNSLSPLVLQGCATESKILGSLCVLSMAWYMCACVRAQLLQLCPTLCDPMGFPLSRDFPGKNTGVGCHALLQGILQTQGSNSHLLHCRWVLYPLSHLGSPTCVQLAVFKGRKSWTFQESFIR